MTSVTLIISWQHFACYSAAKKIVKRWGHYLLIQYRFVFAIVLFLHKTHDYFQWPSNKIALYIFYNLLCSANWKLNISCGGKLYLAFLFFVCRMEKWKGWDRRKYPSWSAFFQRCIIKSLIQSLKKRPLQGNWVCRKGEIRKMRFVTLESHCSVAWVTQQFLVFFSKLLFDHCIAMISDLARVPNVLGEKICWHARYFSILGHRRIV